MRLFRTRLVAMLGIFSVIFTSCAHFDTYNGEKPRWDLKTEKERHDEYVKFSFEEITYWSRPYFVMDHKNYLDNQVKPLIEYVSPEAWSKLESAHTIGWVNLGVLVAGLSLAGAAFATNEGTSQVLSYTSLGLTGVFISFAFWGSSFRIEAGNLYNEKLKSKLLGPK